MSAPSPIEHAGHALADQAGVARAVATRFHGAPFLYLGTPE